MVDDTHHRHPVAACRLGIPHHVASRTIHLHAVLNRAPRVDTEMGGSPLITPMATQQMGRVGMVENER